MSDPLISVILPVFNSEDYIEAAVKSILSQSYTNFELIIINDGSTDRSEEKILQFKDERIRYIRNEKNIGLARSLNKAMGLSAANYIARMDQDDVSLPHRFKKQIEFLLQHPEIAILGTEVDVIDKDGKWVDTWHFPTDPEQVRSDIYKSCCFAHPSVMFLKDKIVEAGLYREDQVFNEDYELWIRLLKNNKGANLNETLLQYRIHQDQISSNNILKQAFVCALIQKEIRIDFSMDIEQQVKRAGFTDEQINTALINSVAFWIVLYLKMNCIHESEGLLKKLRGNMVFPGSHALKTLNTLDIKIQYKKKDFTQCLLLLFKRAQLMFF